ncbi:MarR family transcriptional regulator [Apilactobacillus micheneri]|uniref:MarR family transcriptional regulator n=1 Tax=Apilactobacillus micheneri TaxID=1899430 RepID=A0ABY2Z2N0_9LACO|nr:MarR family transcriptional regulator [Apilactobacillus micheneri]TPR26314.1 MarR family transcriptional regulator [Apilactobacillus micheneri]TPR27068.1 MarR family transcriptional regulator [Apilactobacillus micheneri]TPR27926.1 MarR family transcriptional regulator [Apilactobacillus micheneri]TPR31831.1 MarR family transcriptional regulator [Apilactobacillus micheneri]TPR32235.1 MarR family transcriptional regulator [Apilactobacillus micheneri]
MAQKDILRNIGTIARALDSISNIEFKKYNLSKGQYLFLVRIYENPGIIAKRLADLVCVDKTTASRSINKLIKNGLVKRMDDNKNKKNKHLYVSEKGKKIYPIIKRENEYSNDVALNGLTENEINNLSVLLSKATENVVNNWDTVKNGSVRKY